jgi:hypothetical protein
MPGNGGVPYPATDWAREGSAAFESEYLTAALKGALDP